METSITTDSALDWRGEALFVNLGSLVSDLPILRGRPIVSRSLAAIGVDGLHGMADYLVHNDLLHVVKIEPLNGAKPKARRGKDRT